LELFQVKKRALTKLLHRNMKGANKDPGAGEPRAALRRCLKFHEGNNSFYHRNCPFVVLFRRKIPTPLSHAMTMSSPTDLVALYQLIWSASVLAMSLVSWAENVDPRAHGLRLLKAAKVGDLETFTALSQSIDSKNSPSNPLYIRDNDGRTLLSWAAGNGHREIVQLLLTHFQYPPPHRGARGSALPQD